MSQIITDAFASYWQQCLVDQTPVVLDEFVLAHIPGLDPDAPIDPAGGLPPADQIVHRHPVDQRGRVNNDAVAYSIVMDTTVGNFTFNAMYLINTAEDLVGMIVHKGEESKLKTDPASGQTGNSLVKSMLMEYDRAAEASQTVIDASTWQIDYAARLRGMDEDMRRQALGTFGHAAFYGDGFKLLSDAGRYLVQPGQGYVGGLLVELAGEQEVSPDAKPVGLWLDVYRAGSLLSPWVNHVTLTLSATDLVDYVDANGYPHYVTRLATINSDGSVTDTRAKRTVTLTGDVTGEAVLEGPDNVHIEVEVKDDSHRHSIDTLDGLEDLLEEKQPLDPLLTALAALATVPDSMAYFTGVDTAALTTLTEYARSLLAAVDAAAARSTLGALYKGGDTATGPLIAPKFTMNDEQGTEDGDAVRYDFLNTQIPKRPGLCSSDLNTHTSSGIFHQSSESTAADGQNYPAPLRGSLLVLPNGGGLLQIYITWSSTGWQHRHFYYRTYFTGSFSSWLKIYDTGNPPTPDEIGAAPVSHTHPPADVGAAPISHTHTMDHVTRMNPGTGAGGSSLAVNMAGKSMYHVAVVLRGRAVWLTAHVSDTTLTFTNRGGENADRDYDGVLNASFNGTTLTLYINKEFTAIWGLYY